MTDLIYISHTYRELLFSFAKGRETCIRAVMDPFRKRVF